ncbi:MAG: hypothetical protein A2504_01855 [Bdellovibrionales bacterium RIFOXYD12_FULL_39_22]|nr:MAG: hypothetical protein A2385_04380 [Bdellovibrionales bacterium RIFOXYB1_FULL_39_21]OFZ42349.1 MAG: hypothetical protein A2485_15115 [Bdellovibrionales bacterium RIFOXYC12_FULL_39_17]OFZ46350.1 MAG: hypothetical protein A2404_13900 [Bdellovibrionales bacterium RIFOXYC1_FULL_39_130]OFZ72805.1 MAG: hypothetical protein A2451_13030 [Bdellovibrionales bacterium RIFOXYC2_FULL_39_8]OFZ75243.1 MAG: hypothetical protein A2560_15955 [Bdellovibrionales bacterium RIFOXYD1_FULL_39_84]OFZ93237.1 MAG:
MKVSFCNKSHFNYYLLLLVIFVLLSSCLKMDRIVVEGGDKNGSGPTVVNTPVYCETGVCPDDNADFPVNIDVNMAGVVLVDEDFNDMNYGAPLSYYTGIAYDEPIIYHSENTGYSIQFSHSTALAGIGTLLDLSNYLGDGVYFRYFVNYPEDYYFPGDMGMFDNLKMLKISGSSGDIEFIYKDSSSGGPKSLQLYWINNSGVATGGTGAASVSLGKTLSKGEWHKIEIYIKIATPSIVHVQVDDYDVYKNNDADIRLPSSGYGDAEQFMSVRASNSGIPPEGHGNWFHDDITIIYNGGDLCDTGPALTDSN